LWAGVLYGLVITVASGTLMLALSALSRRSIYVGIAWAGIIFLSHMTSSIMTGVQGDIERREIVTGGIQQWVKDHPPPPGVEMSGWYPIRRYQPPRGKDKERDEKAKEQTREERARERWLEAWDAEWNRLRGQAEDARATRGYTDWRPVLSFANNLDRIGDLLLGADDAWVVLGRAFERPRQVLEIAKGRSAAVLNSPPNERRFAEQRVWQFPWYWSASVLGSVCLLSVFVLSRRVKSLDRLK
jgi:hypothetical protein